MSVHVKVNGAWTEIGGGPAAPTYNNAIGGDIAEFSAGGRLWRTHTFTSSGNFTVLDSGQPFRVLAVGGGANGGGWDSWGWTAPGAGGGGGEVLDLTGQTFPAGSLPVTVGNANEASSVGSLITARPGVGGACGDGVHVAGGGTADNGGGGGGAGADGSGPSGGAGLSSDIRGTTEWFGGGGGGGGRSGATVGGGGGQGGGGAGVNDRSTPASGTPNTGGGGGGGGKMGDTPTPGSQGGSGIVVISYEIAPPPPSPWGEMTGGEINEYEQDGRRYRSHTLLASGDLTVVKEGLFDVFLAGGGGAGGIYMGPTGGGGGAGGFWKWEKVWLDAGAVPGVVGAGGGWNEDGGATSLGTQFIMPGGGCGNLYSNGPRAGASGGGGAPGFPPYGNSGSAGTAGGGGGAGGGPNGGSGGVGKVCNWRTGADVTYCKGGDAGGNPGYSAPENSGNGGVGASGDGGQTKAGSGIIIVRYEIA